MYWYSTQLIPYNYSFVGPKRAKELTKPNFVSPPGARANQLMILDKYAIWQKLYIMILAKVHNIFLTQWSYFTYYYWRPPVKDLAVSQTPLNLVGTPL